MTGIDWGFFRALLRTPDGVALCRKYGIGAESFSGGDKALFGQIMDHFERYHVLPQEDTVAKWVGGPLPDTIQEPVLFWADAIKRRLAANMIAQTITDGADMLRAGDIDTASDLLKDVGRRLSLQTETIKLSLLQELSATVFAAHMERQRKTRIVGVPFGFEYLDYISDGVTPGDTVALAGETGVGKTYLLCRMALAAYRAGFTPLFISMEMADTAIARRLIALRTGVNETRLRKGLLATHIGQIRILKDLAEQEQEAVPFYILEGGLRFKTEDLSAMILGTTANVVFIDGAYMLRSSHQYAGKWDNVAESAEQLKMLAISLCVPIISSYQINDRKEIFGARAIKHLASMVLYVERDAGPDGAERWDGVEYRLLRIMKGRQGEGGVIRIRYDMRATAIEQDSVVIGVKQDGGDYHDGKGR